MLIKDEATLDVYKSYYLATGKWSDEEEALSFCSTHGLPRVPVKKFYTVFQAAHILNMPLSDVCQAFNIYKPIAGPAKVHPVELKELLKKRVLKTLKQDIKRLSFYEQSLKDFLDDQSQYNLSVVGMALAPGEKPLPK